MTLGGNSAPGAWLLVLRAWCCVLGAACLVLRAWCWVLGAGCLVLGAWCWVLAAACFVLRALCCVLCVACFVLNASSGVTGVRAREGAPDNLAPGEARGTRGKGETAAAKAAATSAPHLVAAAFAAAVASRIRHPGLRPMRTNLGLPTLGERQCAGIVAVVLEGRSGAFGSDETRENERVERSEEGLDQEADESVATC